MLSYNEFEQCMNDIKHDYDFYEAVSDATNSEFMFENLRAAGVALDLLAEVMCDEGEWINYFIFELDWGESYEPGCVTIEDKDIPLANLRDLYVLLLSESSVMEDE